MIFFLYCEDFDSFCSELIREFSSPNASADLDYLKSALTSAPILAFPNFAKPFILCTDASGESLSAVLMQQGDSGKNRAIAYANRVLSGPESRYSTTHLEALAVVWVLRHYRDLIYGYDIIVYTDHQVVKDLFKGKNLTGRLARWLMILEDYNPKIEYLPGRANVVADCLSRHAVAAPVSSVVPSFSIDSLRRAQREDPLWSQVLYALEEGDSSSVPVLPVRFGQFH